MIFVSNRKLLIDYTCVEIDKKKGILLLVHRGLGGGSQRGEWEGGGVDSESINCSLQI